MTIEQRKELYEKVREFGFMVGSTKIDGTTPNEMLALCSLGKAIDEFLTVFKKAR